MRSWLRVNGGRGLSVWTSAMRAATGALLALCMWLAPVAQAAPEAPQPAPDAPTAQKSAPETATETGDRPSQGRLPKLPQSLPPGYVMEAKGRVRWIYPESAQDTVAELQEQTPTHFATLSAALGQEIASDLDIRVAIDPNDMRKLVDGRALPDYATGVAFPAQGLILLSLTAPESFQRPAMDALLMHELAHVALFRAVGSHGVPRWFTEGVAIHFAKERSIARIRTLWGAALAGQLLPADDLSMAFPADHHSVDVAYAQSADLVRYMVEGKDDRRRFRDLVAAMQEGQSFPEAVSTSYHVSLGYLEREWRSQVTRRFGPWPTALAGITGIWALGALLLLVGYLRARRRHRETVARWEIEEAQEEQRLAAEAQAEALTNATIGDPVRPPTTGPEAVLERIQEQQSRTTGVPTVRHDGQRYTLH